MDVSKLAPDTFCMDEMSPFSGCVFVCVCSNAHGQR